MGTELACTPHAVAGWTNDQTAEAGGVSIKDTLYTQHTGSVVWKHYKELECVCKLNLRNHAS